MNTGDVIFVKGNTIISKIIRLFDPGHFSHVAIAISKDRVIEAQYNIKSSIAPLHYEDYEVVPMNLSEVQKRNLIWLLSRYTGKKYDFLMALSMATDSVRVDNPNYLICTELVIELLQDVGKLEGRIGKMRPNQFYKYLKMGVKA